MIAERRLATLPEKTNFNNIIDIKMPIVLAYYAFSNQPATLSVFQPKAFKLTN